MADDLTTAAASQAAQNAMAAPNTIRSLNSNDVLGAADGKKFDKAMQDYEGVFLSQMMSHMYDTVPVDPMFGGGAGEQTFRSLLVNEYGKKMAAAGGVGLAAAMKKQLLAEQEQVNAARAHPAGTADTSANAAETTTDTTKIETP